MSRMRQVPLAGPCAGIGRGRDKAEGGALLHNSPAPISSSSPGKQH